MTLSVLCPTGQGNTRATCDAERRQMLEALGLAREGLQHDRWCRECAEMSCETCGACRSPEALAAVTAILGEP